MIVDLNIKNENGGERAYYKKNYDMFSSKNQHLIFGKKYLSNINCEETHIKFNVFETFILVRDKDSNLMLSFEQDFDTDDWN